MLAIRRVPCTFDLLPTEHAIVSSSSKTILSGLLTEWSDVIHKIKSLSSTSTSSISSPDLISTNNNSSKTTQDNSFHHSRPSNMTTTEGNTGSSAPGTGTSSAAGQCVSNSSGSERHKEFSQRGHLLLVMPLATRFEIIETAEIAISQPCDGIIIVVDYLL